MDDLQDLKDWYSAEQAARVLSKNSHTEVKQAYVRQLVYLKKIRTLKLGNRTNLYCKEDVDAYRVEGRGRKSGRAKQARHAKQAA